MNWYNVREIQALIAKECKKTKTAKGLVGAVVRVMKKVAIAHGYSTAANVHHEVGMAHQEGRWVCWFDCVGHLGIHYDCWHNENWYLETEWGTRQVAYRGGW